MDSVSVTHDTPRRTGVLSARAAAQSIARPTTAQHCPNCQRSRGDERSCQFCRQVDGLPVGVVLSSPAKRLGACVVDTVLAVVTLGIGWLVWSLIVYGRGQTPGKQLLGMRCVNLDSGRPSGWGRTFLREWIVKGLASVLVQVTYGLFLLASFWLLWDRNKQELWDKVVGTIVVDDPSRRLG